MAKTTMEIATEVQRIHTYIRNAEILAILENEAWERNNEEDKKLLARIDLLRNLP